MSAPAISVIVPTYQRRALVPRAVAGALAQTHPSFEVVVVDDGSTDGTREALAGLVRDGRIRYLRQPNRGVAAARNAGIRASRGAVIAFLDSDNRWLPQHLSVVDTALARHPEAVLASTCPGFDLYGREAAARARLVDPLPQLLTIRHAGYTSGIAVRREAVEEAGGFDEELRVREDTDLWDRLALRGPFSLVARRTIVVHRTPGSLRRRARRDGALDATESSAARLLEEMERSERDEIRRCEPRARGQLRLVAGIRALDAGDRAGARRALHDACALLPELHEEACGHVLDFFAQQLPRSDDPHERLRRMASAAELWPEPEAETAQLLRARGAAAAVRAGRPRAALGLLARWPRGAVPAIPALARDSLLYAVRHQLPNALAMRR